MRLLGLLLCFLLLATKAAATDSLLKSLLGGVSDDSRCGSEFGNKKCSELGRAGDCCSKHGFCARNAASCLKRLGCQAECDDSLDAATEAAQGTEPVDLEDVTEKIPLVKQITNAVPLCKTNCFKLRNTNAASARFSSVGLTTTSDPVSIPPSRGKHDTHESKLASETHRSKEGKQSEESPGSSQKSQDTHQSQHQVSRSQHHSHHPSDSSDERHSRSRSRSGSDDSESRSHESRSGSRDSHSGSHDSHSGSHDSHSGSRHHHHSHESHSRSRQHSNTQSHDSSNLPSLSDQVVASQLAVGSTLGNSGITTTSTTSTASTSSAVPDPVMAYVASSQATVSNYLQQTRASAMKESQAIIDAASKAVSLLKSNPCAFGNCKGKKRVIAMTPNTPARPGKFMQPTQQQQMAHAISLYQHMSQSGH